MLAWGKTIKYVEQMLSIAWKHFILVENFILCKHTWALCVFFLSFSLLSCNIFFLCEYLFPKFCFVAQTWHNCYWNFPSTIQPTVLPLSTKIYGSFVFQIYLARRQMHFSGLEKCWKVLCIPLRVVWQNQQKAVNYRTFHAAPPTFSQTSQHRHPPSLEGRRNPIQLTALLGQQQLHEGNCGNCCSCFCFQ